VRFVMMRAMGEGDSQGSKIIVRGKMRQILGSK
jgi:hypothetical protein